MDNEKRGDRETAREVTVEKIVPILYTSKEAAAFCMMSESNWYKLNRQGDVPKPIRFGTMQRWRKSDLIDWVAAGCPRDWNNGGGA